MSRYKCTESMSKHFEVGDIYTQRELKQGLKAAGISNDKWLNQPTYSFFHDSSTQIGIVKRAGRERMRILNFTIIGDKEE